MIETRGLTKRFGSTIAVNGLDLNVGAGELFGFIGPNGAGKTTTIQILATLLPPTSGVALVDGMDVRQHGREVRRRIGYMPDFLGLYESLRVHEYLEFFAAAYDLPSDRRAMVIGDVLELTGLTGSRESMVGDLSRGMQQRLGLARVLVHDPKVLLLDEPASGLDPRARVELREILKELRAMGKTILISSHILSDLAEICSSVGILSHGRLIASGTVADVVARIGAGSFVKVRLETPLDGTIGALRGLAGVESVEEVGVTEVRLRVKSGQVRASDIASFLIARGARLAHLEEEGADLEEAYMRLTEGDAK